jgi:glycosyltransferase involved in cell wall biosynthesis
MLLKLLERIDRKTHSFHVFSLTGLGEIGPRIQALGVPVEALGMRRGVPSPTAVLRLARRLRQVEAELVHTWMYHADLLGGIAARMSGVRTIVWCIRNSTLDRNKSRLSTRLVARVNALVSHWLPDGVVSCAEAARDYHVALGYAADKMAVIPNGFDLSRFQPDADARASVRAELGLPASTPLVGVVGRNDPQKNHTGFLEAAASVQRSHPGVHFVLVGAGLDRHNTELAAAAQRFGVAESVHWLGRRQDIARLMASLDVLVSSSGYGEAFPNVIGEAMSCGVPCVVTDVGDSAVIVGDTGRVVSAGDMPSLAAAVADLLALGAAPRAALGQRARARVQEHFEIGQVVRRYEDYYAQLVRRAAQPNFSPR